MTIEQLEAKIADNQAKIDLKIEQAKILSDCNERIAEAQEVLNDALAYKSVVQSYLADSREQILESMESIVDVSNGIISQKLIASTNTSDTSAPTAEKKLGVVTI